MASVMAMGSSPLARGTLDLVTALMVVSRIIPACAGNTEPPCGADHRPPDHPRLRGEHDQWPSDFDDEVGSSPLARGTPLPSIDTGTTMGIIPACAGNTERHIAPCSELRDHPRLRGEHTHAVKQIFFQEGSSPLARGTLQTAGWSLSSHRIIPACAGNTIFRLLRYRSSWDHPRLRGEHQNGENQDPMTSGSSPLARGTRRGWKYRTSGYGIIPACAGNTPLPACRRWRSPDHPRLRGEHPRGPLR